MDVSSNAQEFGENLWVIAQPMSDVPGQWFARCLNLDVVSFGSSLEHALRAAAAAVASALRLGAAPRLKVEGRDSRLLELLLRRGTAGAPSPGAAHAVVASQFQVAAHPGQPNVTQLPPVWLERRVLLSLLEPSSVSARWQRWRNTKRHPARCGRPASSPSRDFPMPSAPDIIVTTQDFDRLQHLIRCSSTMAAEQLDAELARARLVAQREVPADVVTMNSNVVYEDAASGVQRAIRLVYPKDAASARGWVSVLAPIGSALLGLRPGQEIDWPTPGGARRLRVVSVPYQPERHGDYAL